MENFIYISADNTDRPIHVRASDITAVAGPTHSNEPVAPGKSNEYWQLEVFMRDQKVHTCRFADKQSALITLDTILHAPRS